MTSLLRISGGVLSAALLGCAIAATAKGASPAAEYQRYARASAILEPKRLLEEYWAEEIAQKGVAVLNDDSPENTLRRNAILFSVDFPAQFTTVSRINEAVDGRVACVLVVGLTEEETVLAVNIPYRWENAGWRIIEANLRYLGASEEPPVNPACYDQ